MRQAVAGSASENLQSSGGDRRQANKEPVKHPLQESKIGAFGCLGVGEHLRSGNLRWCLKLEQTSISQNWTGYAALTNESPT